MRDMLLVVLLPIVLVVAWVAARTWRGRAPSRPLLNAVFSLLLAAYVLVTAGLGLFWVAHQHLPVFDWHYVFGYAMLVLLAVHLAFNARTLLFQLRRAREPQAPRPPAGTAGPPARRPVLGLLAGAGVTRAAGLGYLLGLRHGRTEVVVAAAGQAAPPGAALAFVERFHALSSHSRAGLVSRAPSTDWGAAVPPFKADTGTRQVALGGPGAAWPAGGTGTLTLGALGAVLWHATGVRERHGGIAFRTAPSSGALFATELTVAARSVEGLPPGTWHYQPQRHALQALREGEPPPALAPAGAAAVVWATAVFRRSGRKYGDRAYRYVLVDLGHALENLRQASADAGWALRWLPVFDEQAAALAMGIDEREEGVLAAASLQPPGVSGFAGRPVETAPGAGTPAMPGLAGAAGPDADAPVRLGMTSAVHAASSLRGVQPGVAPHPPVAAAPPPDPAAQVLPPGVPLAMPLAQRIARRRSRRRYLAQPLPLPVLATLLDALQPQQAQLSGAVGVHVLTPAVAGLAPAVWRLDPLRRALQPVRPVERAALQQQARAAALDQDAAGAAAAVLVLSIDRATVAGDPLGPARGYRHALIEAGMVGERAYLAATALGLGVCGIGAFFDDELSALLALPPQRDWPVHLVTLGLAEGDD
jgi:SagB-type dehydrogenase family enzyme